MINKLKEKCYENLNYLQQQITQDTTSIGRKNKLH